MLRIVARAVLTLTIYIAAVAAQDIPGRPLKLGYIGSLTGFAAPYGKAVLDGVNLALPSGGADPALELYVEDDRSLPRELATAYLKLRTVNHIDALITGSWWADSIVPKVKSDSIPLISCETLYGQDFVAAPNYFSLQGDFRDWIRVFRPLVERRGWKTAAMVKFVSGSADTMLSELRTLFSSGGRQFLRAFEYADFDMRDAPNIAAQIKVLSPQVLYVDAQPSGFAGLMSKLKELGIAKLIVLSHPCAYDAYQQKLFDPEQFPGEIYYSFRESYRPEFEQLFRSRYGRNPELNADLGYYAVKLLQEAFHSKSDPVRILKAGHLLIDGIEFTFDEHNVYQGLKQNVFTFRAGRPEQISLEGTP